jgi:hypothetical protein
LWRAGVVSDGDSLFPLVVGDAVPVHGGGVRGRERVGFSAVVLFFGAAGIPEPEDAEQAAGGLPDLAWGGAVTGRQGLGDGG